MNVAATSSALGPAPTVSGPNPWESEAVRGAIATLNDSKASAESQVSAYKTITDLISSGPTQGGPSRVAVVTDAGFTRFAERTNTIGAQLNRGATARDSSSTYRQLANFDAMSADDQLILARLNPTGSVEAYRAHLQASADIGKTVEDIFAKTGFHSVSQLTDKRFDGLKSLRYQPTSEWTEKAQAVLADLGREPIEDKVDLTPEAQALARLSAPTTATSASQVALQMMTTAAEKKRAAEEASSIEKKLQHTPYAPGTIESKTV